MSATNNINATTEEADLLATMPAHHPVLKRTDDYVPIVAAAAAGGAGLRALSSAGSLHGDLSLEHLLPRQVSLHGVPSGLKRQRAIPPSAAEAAAAAAVDDDEVHLNMEEIAELSASAQAAASAAFAEMQACEPVKMLPPVHGLTHTRNAWGIMSMYAPATSEEADCLLHPRDPMRLSYTPNARGEYSMYAPPCNGMSPNCPCH